MSEYLDQIAGYFETVPLWPFVLFGFIGIFSLAIGVINRRRRLDAIDNFRHTIETELAGMYPRPINWPNNVNKYLCDRLPEMQENFEVLRLFIPQDSLHQYNEDWNKYRDFCFTVTDEKCIEADQSSDIEPHPKEVFCTLVSNLLRHAKKA